LDKVAQRGADPAMDATMAAKGIAPEAAAPVAAEAAPVASGMEDFARAGVQSTKPAWFGGKAGQDELAGMIAPDMGAMESAGRLDIPLSPVTATTNPHVNQARQLEASKVGSDAAVQMKQEIADMSSNLYRVFDDKLGAKVDTSGLSSDVAGSMTKRLDDLETSAEGLYETIKTAMPKTTPVRLDNLRKYTDELKTIDEAILSPGQKTLINLVEKDDVSYATLDTLRKQVGQQQKGKESLFKSTELGNLKNIYRALAEDQLAAVSAVSDDLASTYKKALSTVIEQKDLEEKIVAYYGTDLSGGIVPAIRASITTGVKGSDKTLNDLMNTVPKHLQKEVLTSAMLAHIRRAGSETSGEGASIGFGAFNHMWRGMKEQSTVWSTVNSVLGKDAVKIFDDIYNVSYRLEKNLGSINTGKANQSLKENLMGAETLMTKILGLGKQAIVKGAINEGAATMIGLPSGGAFAAGAAHAIMNNKRDVVKALSDVLGSDDFQKLVMHRSQTGDVKPGMVKRFANSPAFKRLIEKSGQFSDEFKDALLSEASAREKLVMGMLQGSKNIYTQQEKE